VRAYAPAVPTTSSSHAFGAGPSFSPREKGAHSGRGHVPKTGVGDRLRCPKGHLNLSLMMTQPNRPLNQALIAATTPASQASSPPPFASASGTNQLGAAGGAQFFCIPTPFR
jgi:hypothetical protein